MLAFVLFIAPSFPTGKELFAEVDRRLANVRSYRYTALDIVRDKRTVGTTLFLRGGYAKQEDDASIYIQQPEGGWIVDKRAKGYERLKKGDLVIDPFVWHRWATPKDRVYGKVTGDGTVYRTSLRKRGDDTRVEVEIDRRTLLPTRTRILYGASPEVEKSRTVFLKFELGVRLAASDFDYQVSDAAHEVLTSDGAQPLPVGSVAPDFRMRLASGGETTLAKCLQGKKALLVSFWFYACGPCRQELPTLVKLHKEFEDKGLRTLTINGVDSEQTIRAFYASRKVPFSAAVGTTDPKALAAYRFGPCPMTLLIDGQGRIAYAHSGFDPDKTYGTLVDELAKQGIVR